MHFIQMPSIPSVIQLRIIPIELETLLNTRFLQIKNVTNQTLFNKYKHTIKEDYEKVLYFLKPAKKMIYQRTDYIYL